MDARNQYAPIERCLQIRRMLATGGERTLGYIRKKMLRGRANTKHKGSKKKTNSYFQVRNEI